MKEPSNQPRNRLDAFIDRLLLPIAAIVLTLPVAAYLLDIWLP